jgi:hypothetical protein
MAKTSITRSEMRSILKQAQREQEADEAGFLCHADMVEDHRMRTRTRLLSRRDQRRAEAAETAM